MATTTGGTTWQDDARAVLDLLAAKFPGVRDAIAGGRAVVSKGDLSIQYGWLVYEAGEHTCAGGTPESGGAHEPGCGFLPELDLTKLDGWPRADAHTAAIAEKAREFVAAVHAKDRATSAYEDAIDARNASGRAIHPNHAREDQLQQAVYAASHALTTAKGRAAQTRLALIAAVDAEREAQSATHTNPQP